MTASASESKIKDQKSKIPAGRVSSWQLAVPPPARGLNGTQMNAEHADLTPSQLTVPPTNPDGRIVTLCRLEARTTIWSSRDEGESAGRICGAAILAAHLDGRERFSEFRIPNSEFILLPYCGKIVVGSLVTLSSTEP